LIALPWAALQLSGDPLVLASCLAMVGVPRAAFILVGSAFVDRHSPQRVLMLSKHVSTVLLAVLACGIGFGLLNVAGLCRARARHRARGGVQHSGRDLDVAARRRAGPACRPPTG
jgi:hypothetical protein